MATPKQTKAVRRRGKAPKRARGRRARATGRTASRAAKLENFRKLVETMTAIQVRARALGLFVEDRELLECPKCGLQEDVTYRGELVTCRPELGGSDTGLRFVELSRRRFRCPACGALVREPARAS